MHFLTSCEIGTPGPNRSKLDESEKSLFLVENWVFLHILTNRNLSTAIFYTQNGSEKKQKILGFLAVFFDFLKNFPQQHAEKTPQDWFLGYFLPPNQILRDLVTPMLQLVLKR